MILYVHFGANKQAISIAINFIKRFTWLCHHFKSFLLSTHGNLEYMPKALIWIARIWQNPLKWRSCALDTIVEWCCCSVNGRISDHRLDLLTSKTSNNRSNLSCNDFFKSMCCELVMWDFNEPSIKSDVGLIPSFSMTKTRKNCVETTLILTQSSVEHHTIESW